MVRPIPRPRPPTRIRSRLRRRRRTKKNHFLRAMSRRRREQPDSLELLLDTMCNTFGGIIMIALLIALLSRDPSQSDAAQRAENVQRQVQSIAQQTTEAERLHQRLLQSADPSTTNTLNLLSQRDELRQRIDSTR